MTNRPKRAPVPSAEQLAAIQEQRAKNREGNHAPPPDSVFRPVDHLPQAKQPTAKELEALYAARKHGREATPGRKAERAAPVAREYVVIGHRKIAGHDKGETVLLAEVTAVSLIEAGHVQLKQQRPSRAANKEA